eukprot:CAMPEP_0196166366 /NCGR_PEP_ID=MMETSP0911-20130528/1923_1 /TAXON_ID=49265 /ORGANISM="Thalassiosira rotula, Strain GSO102" /LENGTH=111 /DNA_ID=CAMNT_0041431981 /DNA_START=65 /DNA_END=401 /DNA_ORIENTATION=+
MPTSYDPMLTDPPIIFPGDAIPRPSSPMPQTPVCLPCNPPVEPPPDDEVAKVRKMLNAQKASRKKDHNFTDEEIMEANDLRLMKLGGVVAVTIEGRGKGLKIMWRESDVAV